MKMKIIFDRLRHTSDDFIIEVQKLSFSEFEVIDLTESTHELLPLDDEMIPEDYISELDINESITIQRVNGSFTVSNKYKRLKIA